MFRSVPAKLALCAALVAGCSEPSEKRIGISRVVPSADPGCGAPADGRTMIVRALGDFPASEGTAQSVQLGDEIDFSIDRFPVTTRMIEVEVRGFGGALRTIGRSQSFDIESLPKDASLPVFMAPPDGICPTGPAQSSRRRPLLARAGAGVLVAGGVDEAGDPVFSAELYDPSTGRFEELQQSPYGDTNPLGLRGTSMTQLSTGDVALIGGAATAFQIFDTQSGELGTPNFYREARAHHAALALEDAHVFLAGGCSQVLSFGCGAGSSLLTSSLLDTRSGEIESGPSLQIPRIDGRAWRESENSVLLVGGVDEEGAPVSQAERLFLDGRESQLIDGFFGISAQAESGTIWAGMVDADGNPGSDLSALALNMSEAAPAANLGDSEPGAQLISLEDGAFLSVGLSGARRVRSLEGFARALNTPALEGRSEQGAIRLDDGSVLIVGGRDGEGQATGEALVFRPALTGPLSASATASFSSRALSEGLSARNPGQVSFASEGGEHLRLTVGEQGEEWLVAAGPTFSELALEVAASIESGSLTLLVGFESPGRHWKVQLRGGSKPRLIRVEEALEQELGGCTASTLDVAALREEGQQGHDLRMDVTLDRLRVQVDGSEVLGCDLELPIARALVGVGLEGDPGQSLRLDLISLGR